MKQGVREQGKRLKLSGHEADIGNQLRGSVAWPSQRKSRTHNDSRNVAASNPRVASGRRVVGLSL